MSERVDAVFENGVFRPDVPVNIANGERVSLDVERRPSGSDDLAELSDLLDVEFTESCRRNSAVSPSLEEVRNALSSYQGSIAQIIAEERDER